MAIKLTASDRSALIRLASSMPAGSTERKAILAGLAKTSTWGDGPDLADAVQQVLSGFLVGQGLDADSVRKLEAAALEYPPMKVLIGLKAWAMSENAEGVRQAQLLIGELAIVERQGTRIPTADMNALHGESAHIAYLCKDVFTI